MSLRQQISTLWIVVMINMAFADILSFMYPTFLTQVATGTVDGVTITPMFMLIAAVLIEVGILMIYLSHVLKPKAARITNLVAVVITILFVVGGGSLKPHYIFFASVEVLALLYIARLAWGWKDEAKGNA
ncbi:DUF6326 family protein [Maritalea sp.]|uniref:DUF6326 family protein n=1 Tax=Maritalea sp. TaxID=2003361 RepID=UPI003EF7BC1F